MSGDRPEKIVEIRSETKLSGERFAKAVRCRGEAIHYVCEMGTPPFSLGLVR